MVSVGTVLTSRQTHSLVFIEFQSDRRGEAIEKWEGKDLLSPPYIQIWRGIRPPCPIACSTPACLSIYNQVMKMIFLKNTEINRSQIRQSMYFSSTIMTITIRYMSWVESGRVLRMAQVRSAEDGVMWLCQQTVNNIFHCYMGGRGQLSINFITVHIMWRGFNHILVCFSSSVGGHFY